MEPIPVMENVVEERSSINTLLLKVYLWMVMGLGITAVVAMGVEFGLPGIRRVMLENIFIFYGLLILELAIVWGLSRMINRMPPIIAMLVFFGYAGLNGLTLSIIFLVYNIGSIFVTFGVTAMMFAGTSLLGYITKMDLSRIGAFLMMALMGLIITSIVNLFLNASGLEWIICVVGVIIFVGLTAWDTQKIKRWSEGVAANSADGNRASIIGALMLYLDFINIFLFLLRLFGDRD